MSFGDLWPVSIEKVLGALAGASASVAISHRASSRDMIKQTIVGFCCGMIFGTLCGRLIDRHIASFSEQSELFLAGCFVAGFGAWEALSFILRVFSRANSPKELIDGVKKEIKE